MTSVKLEVADGRDAPPVAPVLKRRARDEADGFVAREYKSFRRPWFHGETRSLRPDGHVQGRVDLKCDDDFEAMKLTKKLVDGHDVELWHLDRHVETFRHTSERRMD
jgi:hypothetical protein